VYRKYRDHRPQLQALYIKSAQPFEEVEQFIDISVSRLFFFVHVPVAHKKWLIFNLFCCHEKWSKCEKSWFRRYASSVL